MEKEKLEGQLIDYIDGKLDATERSQVEMEISKNEEAYQLYEQLKKVMQIMDNSDAMEPGPGLKQNFDRFLKSEVGSQTKSKTIFFQPTLYRIAAGFVLIMVGVGIGYWINKGQQQAQELAELKKEMESTKQVMMAMLENRQSASQRIQGMNVALGIEKADDDVVQALSRALQEDPNTNVRLAALEALSKFQQEPGVRKILVRALSKQTDPVVQIALIQLMVKMKEKGAVKDLERIIEDEGSIKAVKDEAYTGILKLS